MIKFCLAMISPHLSAFLKNPPTPEMTASIKSTTCGHPEYDKVKVKTIIGIMVRVAFMALWTCPPQISVIHELAKLCVVHEKEATAGNRLKMKMIKFSLAMNSPHLSSFLKKSWKFL